MWKTRGTGGRPSRSCWGFPLGCEVFAGNRNDVTTLEELIERMEAKYGRAKRIWVFDRGIVSESDLEFLRERGGRYFAGTPKKQLRRFEKDLVEADWREVRHGIEVKPVPSAEGEETPSVVWAFRVEGLKSADRGKIDLELANLGSAEAGGQRERSGPAGGVRPPDVPTVRAGRQWCRVSRRRPL